MTKVLTEAAAATDLAGLPRPVSKKPEIALRLAQFYEERHRMHVALNPPSRRRTGEKYLSTAETLRALVSERDALAGRVAELESEVLDQCRLNGMGSERELALMGRVAELEAERDAAWKPLESAPKEPGRYIYVQQHAVYRWLPYKANSHEFKRGKKGRWQQHTGYGFDNAELSGTGWKDTEDAALTANTPESKP